MSSPGPVKESSFKYNSPSNACEINWIKKKAVGCCNSDRVCALSHRVISGYAKLCILNYRSQCHERPEPLR